MSIKNRKRVVADEEGNDLAPPPEDSPAAQIMYLLEWGRQRGFQIGPMIQIGDVIVQARDLRLAKGSPAEPDLGPWVAAGHNMGDE